MASSEAWGQGWALGQGIAQEQRAHKQALADEEFQNKVHDIAQNRLDLQAKLPTLLDENGKPTPEYHDTMGALEQNLKDMRDMFHPQKNPGAIQKFGHILTDALHITKPTPTPNMVIPNPKGLVEAGNLPIWDRPAVQNMDGTYSSEYSTSFKDKNGHEVLVPTIVDGKFLTPDGKKPPEGSDAEKQMFQKAWQHYEQTGQNLGKFTSPEDADRYANRLHNRGKIPKEIQKQEVQQAAGAAADKRGAQQLAAAAPVSPVQAATTAAGAKNAGDLAIIQGKMKNLKTLFPNAPVEQQKKWFEELAQSITGIKAGQEKFFSSLATTKDANGDEHYWRVPMAANQDPEEVDFNGQKMMPKTATHQSTAAEAQWIRATYGKDLAELSPDLASEAISRYKQLNTPTTTSTGQALVYDQNNQPHVFTHTGTSKKTFPGANGAAPTSTGTASPVTGGTSNPANPNKGTAAHRSPGTTASTPRSPIGPAIEGFTKRTPEVTVANKEVVEAAGLDSLANQVAQRPNDAINQKRLAVSLEKMSAGRFTTQALDYVIKAGWGNTLEQWANNPTTGALPQDVVRQLVDGAHENLKAKKDALKQALQPVSGPDSVQGGGQTFKNTATNPQNHHKIGTNDDPKSATAKWFDTQTGKPI